MLEMSHLSVPSRLLGRYGLGGCRVGFGGDFESATVSQLPATQASRPDATKPARDYGRQTFGPRPAPVGPGPLFVPKKPTLLSGSDSLIMVLAIPAQGGPASHWLAWSQARMHSDEVRSYYDGWVNGQAWCCGNVVERLAGMWLLPTKSDRNRKWF